MSKLIRNAKSKLRSRRGDSLAEVLIAVLIVTLALVSLAAMISSSSGRILKSSDQTERYMQAENHVAARDVTPVAGTVTAKVGDAVIRLTDAVDPDTETIPVSFYRDAALSGPNPGISYKVN